MSRSTSKDTDPVRAYFRSLPIHQQLNAVAANIEIARTALLEAAKKADAANLPLEFHRDILFAMDSCRELEATISEWVDR